MTGVVHHYDRLRRFGKITGADRREYFVHQGQLIEVAALQTGQRVTFTPTEFPRGPRALAVRPLEPATSQAEEGWTCPAP